MVQQNVFTGGEFDGVNQSILGPFSHINNVNCLRLSSIQTSNHIFDMLFVYYLCHHGWYAEFDTAKG